MNFFSPFSYEGITRLLKLETLDLFAISLSTEDLISPNTDEVANILLSKLRPKNRPYLNQLTRYITQLCPLWQVPVFYTGFLEINSEIQTTKIFIYPNGETFIGCSYCQYNLLLLQNAFVPLSSCPNCQKALVQIQLNILPEERKKVLHTILPQLYALRAECEQKILSNSNPFARLNFQLIIDSLKAYEQLGEDELNLLQN